MSDPAPATPTPSAPVDPTLNTPAPAPVAGDPPSNPAPAADPAPAAPPAGDPPPAAGDWPSDWRDKYAGGDEKKLKRLQRYGSPAAALDALFNAQQKIAQGIKEPLPADAPPEVVARWREDNGIPQTPDGYKMPDGVVLGENDKPLVDDFLKTAHERNWSPDQVQTAVSWFMERQAAQADAIAARDVEARMQFEDELRSEYGPQYRQEVKRAVEFLRTAPEGLDEKLMGGRLADGTPIGNSPEVIRWLNSLQREMYPAATVVPGAGTNAVQAIESELASLNKMMGDRSSEYWKGPMAARHQARAQELISAQQKQRQRAA
ncbi:MAG: hypothetical protein RI949_2306 [Pseudomonadota bacterium]